MNFLVKLAVLGCLALGLSGCLGRGNGPRYAYGNTSVGSDYVEPVAGRRFHARADAGPDCGSDGKFSPKIGKCVGKELHDIELTEEQKEAFATCDRIETQVIVKNGVPTQQQRGIGCHRPSK